MVLTRIKAKVQLVVANQAKFIFKIGLTPNMISSIGLALAFFSALVYAHGHENLILAVFLLISSGYCDLMDGAVARIYGIATSFGSFLDSILDRYADVMIYFGLIIGGLCSVTWGLTALAGSLLVSYSRARAEAVGVKMETIGVAERPERLLLIIIATLVEVFVNGAIEVAMIILTLTTNLTVLQRSAYTYKALRRSV
ncbi:MAG: archaetidylinositol phosphate synthase [Candidatus Bathyarchaeia archaeon]